MTGVPTLDDWKDIRESSLVENCNSGDEQYKVALGNVELYDGPVSSGRKKDYNF